MTNDATTADVVNCPEHHGLCPQAAGHRRAGAAGGRGDDDFAAADHGREDEIAVGGVVGGEGVAY